MTIDANAEIIAVDRSDERDYALSFFSPFSIANTRRLTHRHSHRTNISTDAQVRSPNDRL